MQKQGKLKNRKPILQTKVQKTAKLTNITENHGLRNNTEGTFLGRKKRTFPALRFFDTQKFLKNKPKRLTKTKNYSIIRQ